MTGSRHRQERAAAGGTSGGEVGPDDAAPGVGLAVLPRLLAGSGGIGLDAIAKLASAMSAFAPSVSSTACPNARWRKKAVCDAACIALCPTKAISVSDVVSIDPSKCISCGICATACPNGVFDPRVPSDTAISDGVFAAAEKRKKKVRFSCDRCGGRYGRTRRPAVKGAGTVVLPCLGSISDAVVVYATRLGMSVVVDPCPAECEFSEGRECYGIAMKRLEAVRRSLVLSTCDPAGTADKRRLAGLDRRRFLVAAGENAARAILNLEEPREEEPARSLYAQSVPSRRKDLLILTNGLASNSVVLGPKEYPILDIGIDDATCDLCEICCTMCPTGALRYEERGGIGSIAFSLGKCTGCGLCEEVCSRKCVRSFNADLGDLNSPPRALVKKAVRRCERCNFKLVGGVSGPGRKVCPACERRRTFGAT